MSLPDLSVLDREEKISILRSKMAAVAPVIQPAIAESGSGSRPGYSSDNHVLPGAEVLPVDSQLGRLISSGGLPRAAVTSVSDSPSMLGALMASVTAAGQNVAVVGLQDFHWAAVEDAGGSLERISVIDLAADSDKDVDPLKIVAVLCEGLDLVILRLGEDSRRIISQGVARAIEARLRSSKCALLVCGMRWPAPFLNIKAELAGLHGLRMGKGRIKALSFDVSVFGKKQSPRSGRWIIGPEEYVRTLEKQEWEDNVSQFKLREVTG